jgi:erythronate-4-phosphate dehydrogenase
LKIFYDENMPYVANFFQSMGELTPFNGRTVNAEDIQTADVLLVRSVTSVDEALLCKNQQIKFVGTATIGVDHIDQSYLEQRDICFRSAPGCNAVSVAEYVISSLVVMCERYQRDLFSLKVGIVGAGNTGSRLSEKLTALGIHHVLYDPPLARTGTDPRQFVNFDEILACDVISLHVPLNFESIDATYHLFDQNTLAQLTPTQWLINACRGEVVNNQAILALKQQNSGPKLVWDVWENEPHILTDLVKYTDIATAHIAGYSLEGKARGTEMLYQALCQVTERPIQYQLTDFLPKYEIQALTLADHFQSQQVGQLITLLYDVRRDDALFRQNITKQGFDWLRKNYPARREFSALTIDSKHLAQSQWLAELGFTLTITES